MPAFQYTARDLSGRSVEGSLAAGDEIELRNMLRGNDLFLTSATGGGMSQGASSTSSGQASENRRLPAGKPSLQDMVIAMRQMATMIRSGMPMMQALEVLGSQATRPILQFVFYELQVSIASGQSLGSSMRHFPEVFNPLVLALVDAGETAGTLDATLEVAAAQLDREAVLKLKVKAALLYPQLVIYACFGTIAAMMLLVVPVYENIYSQLHAKLPMATQILVETSGIFVHGWWLMLSTILGCWFGFKKYRRTPGGSKRIDTIALKLPVIGPILRKIAIARFVQTLSGAFKGGIPVLSSLAISANTADNAVIKGAVVVCAQNVRDGARISHELEVSGEFPMMVTKMMAAGEASGNIELMLDEINRFYERDVEFAVDRLARMIEPAMTLLVGGIVLVVLLGLYSPIFNLGKAFKDAK